GPCWKVGPPVANDSDPPDQIAYGFDRVEHAAHRPPSKLAVADIEHRELFLAEIERLVPLGIVGIEQETADVVPKRGQRRLADLVREAVAYRYPLVAIAVVSMVVVSINRDGVVVVTITIEDDPAGPRNGLEEPRPIDVVAPHQGCRPFEDEERGVA